LNSCCIVNSPDFLELEKKGLVTIRQGRYFTTSHLTEQGRKAAEKLPRIASPLSDPVGHKGDSPSITARRPRVAKPALRRAVRVAVGNKFVYYPESFRGKLNGQIVQTNRRFYSSVAASAADDEVLQS
jgi:hypothetical protein